MAQALQRAWLQRGLTARLLLPLSGLYAVLAWLHRLPWRLGWRRPWRAPVPVLVVGNVVAGGAGKTPVVMALVRHLQSLGLQPGVVSRGYGRSSRGCVTVTPDSTAAQAGDEPLLIARQCAVPVVVCADRPQAVRALLAAHPQVQVVVSDDGLQHAALARDLEIVVFDGRGIGNGWLLPAGPLRERWPRHADLVLRPVSVQGLPGYTVQRRLAAHAVRADGTQRPLADFAGHRCVALAGVARPQDFFDMLAGSGLTLASALPLPDHHDFALGRPDLPDDAEWLCTEKDAVKLWRVRPQAWAVPLQVDLDPAFWRALQQWLDRRLSSPDGPQTA